MRFAFITPRYGGEVANGPEHACRLLAEHLCARHDVEVLTTTARDPRSWKNEYSEGVDRVRGVLVRRFAVSQPYDAAAVLHLSERLFAAPGARAEETEWARAVGPIAPALTEHLRRQHRSFDALVFFSLYHATTVLGLGVAPERSVVAPGLLLGPALRFALWADLLTSARAVALMSHVERRLLQSYVRASSVREEVVGIGVEPSPRQSYPRHQQDPADDAPGDNEWTGDTASPSSPDDDWKNRGLPFRARHRLFGPFVLYGGRIEPDNGCEEMLDYFDTYASSNGDTSLVLMGLKLMRVPDAPYLRQAGVLPDRERMVAFEAADVTVAPGHDDLLGQAVLESLAVGTPVLASARNEVAVEHIRRAGGGLYYANRAEFVEALGMLMSRPHLREQLGRSGRGYVEQQHGWDAVLGRFERLISTLRART